MLPHIQTFFVLFLQLQRIYSSGVLTVRLGEFKNPSGRTYDGTCCDPVEVEDKLCTDQCDYVMRLIVTGLGRANDHVFLFHRPIKYDSNNIEFEHSDNNLLLTVLFDRWPEDGLVKMNAFFYDYDDFDHTTTLVDWFETDLKQSNSTTTPSTAVWGQFQEQTVVGNRQLEKTLLTFDWSIMEPDDEIIQATQNEYTDESKPFEMFTTRASSLKEDILPQQTVATTSHLKLGENTAFYEENYYLTNNEEISPGDYNDALSNRDVAQNKQENINANILIEENNKGNSLLEKQEKVTPTVDKGDNLIEAQYYGVEEDVLEKTEAEYSQNDISFDLLQNSGKTKNYKQNPAFIKGSIKANNDATSISDKKRRQHSTAYRDSSFGQPIQSEIKNVAASTEDKVFHNNNGSLLSSGSITKASTSDSDTIMLENFSNDITIQKSVGDIELGTKGIAGASHNTSSVLGNQSNQSKSTLAPNAEEAPPMLVFHPRVPYGFTTSFPQVTSVQANSFNGNLSLNEITTKINNVVVSVQEHMENRPLSADIERNPVSDKDATTRDKLNHQQSNHSQEDMPIKDKNIIYTTEVNEDINKNSVDKKQINVTMETYMADMTSLSRLKDHDTSKDASNEMAESNINHKESIRNTDAPKTWFNAKKFQKSNGELLHHSIQVLKAVKFQTAAPVMWFVTAQRPDILSENQRYEIVYKTPEISSATHTPDSSKSNENSIIQDAVNKNNVFNYVYANTYSQQPITNEVINFTKSTSEKLEKTVTSPSYLKSKEETIEINSFIASPKGPHINITQPLFSQEHFPNFLYNIYIPGSPLISAINSSLPFTVKAHSSEKVNVTNTPEKPNIKNDFQKSLQENPADNDKTVSEIKNNLSVLDHDLKEKLKQDNSVLVQMKDPQLFVSDKVKLSSTLDENDNVVVNMNNSKHVDSEKSQVVLTYNIPEKISHKETATKTLAESNKKVSKSYNELNLQYRITDDMEINQKIKSKKQKTNSVEETPLKEQISLDENENKKNSENTLMSKVTFDGDNIKNHPGIDTTNSMDKIFPSSIKSTVPQDETTNVYFQFLMSPESPISKISSINNVNLLNARTEEKPVTRNDQENVEATTTTTMKSRENSVDNESYKAVKDQTKTGTSLKTNEDVTWGNQDNSDANRLSRHDKVLNNIISSEDDRIIRTDVLTSTMWPELQQGSTVHAEKNIDVFQQFDISSKKIQHNDNLESANYIREAELNEVNANKNTHKIEQTQKEDPNSKYNKYLIPEKISDVIDSNIQTTRTAIDSSIHPEVNEHKSQYTRIEIRQKEDNIDENVWQEKSSLQTTAKRNRDNTQNSTDNKDTLTQILHPHHTSPHFDNKGVTLNSRHVIDRHPSEHTSSGFSSNTNNTPKDAKIQRTFQRSHNVQSNTQSFADTQGITETPPMSSDDITQNVADPFDLMSLFRANIKLLETSAADKDNIKVANRDELSIAKDKNSPRPSLSDFAMESKKANGVSGNTYNNKAEEEIIAIDNLISSEKSLLDQNVNNKDINQVSLTVQNKQFVQNKHPTKQDFKLTNQDNEIDEHEITAHETAEHVKHVQSLSQQDREQETQKRTFNGHQEQDTEILTELRESDIQTTQNDAILNEPTQKPGLFVGENKPEDQITQKSVTELKSDQRTAKQSIERTKTEVRTSQKPFEKTNLDKRTTQKPIDQTISDQRNTQKPVEHINLEERKTIQLDEHTKSVKRTTQKPVEHSKQEESLSQEPAEHITSEKRTTQKPVEHSKLEERTTQKPVEHSKLEERTTQKPVEQTKPEERTTQKAVVQNKPEEKNTQKPVEQTKPEEQTTQKPVEQTKPEERTTQKPVEQTKLEERNTQKPIEQTKPEEGTTQKPVEQTKPEEQTIQTTIEHTEIDENTTEKSIEQSKPEDRTTMKSFEQNKAKLTTLNLFDKKEQEVTNHPIITSTLTTNSADIQINDISFEKISTIPEILPSVEIKTIDKVPATIKSYQLVNSRNLKSNSLPGILHPVLYVPPTEKMDTPTLELQIPKQTLNTEMKTLPEDGFKLHAIVQNTASVRQQPLQILPSLKLSEAKTGTKRTNIQSNINLDKLRNYMQVIRYRPTVQVPDRGLYTPQEEKVNSTETSAPLLPKSVERYGSAYQPLVGVSTVFTRYWPAVLGVTVGTMFLLTALITSILCRQRRLLIQRARWLDSPRHLSEPPDPSEYATSSAASLTSDLTRSSVNLMGSRHGSR